MVLQSSGAISLLDIQNEFGGTDPISISEYYRGGGLVPSTPPNAGVPVNSSPPPTISLSDFYGASALVEYSISVLLLAGSGGVYSDSESGDVCGGSGAGGLYIGTRDVQGGSNYTVTVGAGGDKLSNGSKSTFPGFPVTYGGGKAYANGLEYSGSSGGSGGGGGAHGYGPTSPAVPSAPGGAGTTNQGNAGGDGKGTTSPYNAGGGGGKGSSGTPGSSQSGGGPGGSGYDIATFKGGPSTIVAYGGGGAAPAFGFGVPGNGTVSGATPPANMGAGVRGEIQGGGKSGTSGRVIVRYPGSTQRGTGGTTYTATVGGTTYFFHEFTASGTFTG